MIRKLEWDSHFFGINTGTVSVEKIEDLNEDELNTFDLVYVFANTATDEQRFKQFSGKLFMADEKLTYIKHLNVQNERVPEIMSIPADAILNDRLVSLAWQAGEYSRFRLDPLLPDSKFKELYSLWIENSVKREIAEEVFVYNENGFDMGMVTLGIKKGVPDIGLIAVDKQYRGSGIGMKLIQSAERWALLEKKLNHIQVVTQGLNKDACRFYEKNGYTQASKQYIYHWWTNKNS